jgi:hypothetical protein
VDGSGSVEFPEFCVMMVKKMRESDIENEVPFTFKNIFFNQMPQSFLKKVYEFLPTVGNKRHYKCSSRQKIILNSVHAKTSTLNNSGD